MTVLAIIPARGGSKGLPQKNVLPICGKPLIAWTIESARSSRYIDRVVVSTDDRAISRISLEHGAEVINRPESISGDGAPSEAALAHALLYLKDHEDYTPTLTVFLQCTSPLTSPEDIDRCVEELLDNQADAAFTVTPFHYFVWQENVDNVACGVNHDQKIRLRRQDRDQQFLETGAVYVFRTDGFLTSRHRFFGKTVFSEMPAERCLEIDELLDMERAEIRLRRFQSDRQIKELPNPLRAVVFDFDGVMTDNKVYVSEDGSETVRCDRSDGWGIDRLKDLDLKLAIMSSERNPVVSARAAKLGIECFQNLHRDKLSSLINWCDTHGISPDELVYVGNDENDIPCLEFASCGVIPSNAESAVRRYAGIVLNRGGGDGAVREICDLIRHHLADEANGGSGFVALVRSP